MSTTAPPSDRWLQWQLRQGASAAQPSTLFHLALRTRSRAALEAVVDLATGGTHTHASLLRAVLHEGPPRVALARGRRRALAGVAFTWAGMQRNREELLAAALIFERLWPTGVMSSFGPQLRLTSLQTVYLAGRHAELRQLLDGDADTELHRDAEHYLRADLANPHAEPASPTADPAAWDRLIGQRFAEAHLSSPRLLEAQAGSTPFDRLGASGPTTQPGSVGGQLVTVIMPCWRPDEGLITAVRSIVEQTYGDLEIVVVDDCSGPGYADIFARAAALDPRVRVLPMERNGGSYLGRAAAIADSTGSLITFQDADDWSHPSRIERQVRALEEAGPAAPMSRSRAVRAKDDLTHQWLGYRAIRDNASSLLLRRSILERTGGFLPVRKGADSEFAERVSLLEGPVVDVEAPLAITRLRSGSLSRGDFTFSWMAPDRFLFRASFMAWHRELRRRRAEVEIEGAGQGAETVAVTDQQLATLPFPVPPAWVRDLPHADRVPTMFDTAYLGCFSRSTMTPGARWLHHHVGAAQVSGQGLWHQEGRGTAGTRRDELAREWDDELLTGRLHPLSRIDRSQVDTLVVLDPGVVPLLIDVPVHVQAQRVEVWVGAEQVTPDPTSGLPEDLLGVSDAVVQVWGVRPSWVLAPWLGGQQADLVREALPGMAFTESARVA